MKLRFKATMLLLCFVMTIRPMLKRMRSSSRLQQTKDLSASIELAAAQQNQNSNSYTADPGIFFCGYTNIPLAQELFPDYMERYQAGLDYETHQSLRFMHPKRVPHQRDILLMGAHGTCKVDIRVFPGKVLFVEGEPYGTALPPKTALKGRPTGQDVYQIGLMPDTPQSVLVYHGAWNFVRLDEAIWPILWDHSLKPINSGTYKGLVYLSRKCHPHREQAVNRISTIMTIYHGSTCKGMAQLHPENPSFRKMPKMPPLSDWASNRETYSDYTFCMAMENSLVPHYISEKIIMAFMSGCIPIYYGSDEIFDVFNRDAFIFYNPKNPAPALRKLLYLVQNQTAYLDMLHHQPILANGEQTVRDYFSVSDRIGGGYLKAKLRRTMGLST